jgi:hypothetical protein
MRAAHLGVVLLALLGSVAAEGAEPQAGAEPRAPRLTAYVRTGLGLYLSETRTQGGVGGGVGVRATLSELFILQVDTTYLMGLGNSMELRVGAGVQRPGTYTPAALLVLSGMAGDSLRFLTPEHPSPKEGPALTLGLQLAPLRFTHQGLQVSVLELGVGLAPELPGLGVAWQVGLLEAGTSF